jgi:dTDP-4-amino-4,6-dideoxygalactose transaminase
LSGIKEGDEVLCQTAMFSATVNPIIYQKAIPVFVGSEQEI